LAIPNLEKKEYCSNGNLDPFFPYAEAKGYSCRVQLLSLLFVPGDDDIGGAFVAKFRAKSSDTELVQIDRVYVHRYAVSSDVVRKQIAMQNLRALLCAVAGADTKDESFEANKTRDQLLELSAAEALEGADYVFDMRAYNRTSKKSGKTCTNYSWRRVDSK
jgi:hypothetical protein